MENVAYFALVFIIGLFIGKRIASYQARKELQAFKDDVKRFGVPSGWIRCTPTKKDQGRCGPDVVTKEF